MQEQVLVIGGGPGLYDNNFFEIGNHSTSKFGIGKDWKNIEFWNELNIILDNYRFPAIIFDNGSKSWLYDIASNVFNYIMIIIKKHMYEDGFILTIGNRVRSSPPSIKILDKLLHIGFNNIGILRFGPIIDDNIFNILSLADADIIDKTNIYPIDINIGIWDQRGFIEENIAFQSVIENNQIEFIRNRLL